MWQRILSFLGWLVAGFFLLIGLFGFTTNPAITLTCIVWGLIFVPPLFRLTWRYGWKRNIGGRFAVFLVSFILGGIFSPPPPVTQSPPITNPNEVVGENIKENTPTPTATITPTPTFTPTQQPTPTIERTSTPTQEVIETSEPERTPEIIETPIPKRTIEPSTTANESTPQPQANPNAPIRAGFSGSCECPYDTDRRGRSCGARSAYSRPGGSQPVCYVGDQR